MAAALTTRYDIARALVQDTDGDTWNRYVVGKLLHRIRLVRPDRHAGLQFLWAEAQSSGYAASNYGMGALLFITQLANLVEAWDLRWQR